MIENHFVPSRASGGGNFAVPSTVIRDNPGDGFSDLRHCRDRLNSTVLRASAQPGMTMNYVDAATAPLRKTGHIKLHGPEAFESMRKAGRLVAECLDMLVPEIRSGITTQHIDQLVFEFAMDHEAMPATLMYRGYAKSNCTSSNHVVCHRRPNDKPLRDRDIVTLDVTL